MPLYEKSWALFLAFFGFVTMACTAVASAYAAERDRRALRDAEPQREKLLLEIARLRNTPEVVADRREIYQRLREVVGAIVAAGSASIEQIRALHGIRHDAEFRYPREVVDGIGALTESAISLHFLARSMQRLRPSVPNGEWESLVTEESNALLDVVRYQTELVAMFRPHLTL